jgi:acyl carrier protein
MEQSTSESVNAGLTEIMRDDMNVDVRRIHPDRFGVALSEEDLLSCDTVADLEAAILAKVPAAQSNS